MKLDDVFEKKDDIANAVKRELNDAMVNYGYDIIKTLVTDIDPDSQVKEAMNRIVIKGTARINSIKSVENSFITFKSDCLPSASKTPIGKDTMIPTDAIIRVSNNPPH